MKTLFATALRNFYYQTHMQFVKLACIALAGAMNSSSSAVSTALALYFGVFVLIATLNSWSLQLLKE